MGQLLLFIFSVHAHYSQSLLSLLLSIPNRSKLFDNLIFSHLIRQVAINQMSGRKVVQVMLETVSYEK